MRNLTKVVCSIIVVAVAYTATNAQAVPTTLDGFWGIKFGSSMVEAKKIILAKKTGKIDTVNSDQDVIVVEDAEFAGKRSYLILISFVNDQFHTGTIFFKSDLDAKVLDLYADFKSDLSDKYGKPSNDFKFFTKPYYSGDGYETQAIRLGKGEVSSFWTFERPDGGKNAISLSVTERLMIKLTYQDGKLIKVSSEQRKNKNSKDF